MSRIIDLTNLISRVRVPIFNRFVVTKNQLPSKLEYFREKSIQPIIDYSVESKGKSKETFHEIVSSFQRYPGNTFALKISGIEDLIQNNNSRFKFIDSIFNSASENKNVVLIDAENERLTPLINEITDECFSRYNRDQLLVYKTYQMYRTDALDTLKRDLEKFTNQNLRIGIKLVRGAYWKEDISKEVLFNRIEDTHKSYNDAVHIILNNLDLKKNSVIFATHNEFSVQLIKDLANDKNIDKKDIKLAQLMGMKDLSITYPSLKEGYSVMKYIPYGPPLETVPYLIRRLQENKYMLKHIW